MPLERLGKAAARLSEATREAHAALQQLQATNHPLARHVAMTHRFYSALPPAQYRRRERVLHANHAVAVEMGFRGGLHEWQRLLVVPQ